LFLFGFLALSRCVLVAVLVRGPISGIFGPPRSCLGFAGGSAVLMV
jgi:hypothetical protein